ncbi:MAG: dihydroneopterin aldolase [Spirochaetaceae bacterium]|nr:dihydroneopterin aldolase [Spirochaetaceae bacterium]MDT8299477.1 dihydroneopterin aldolase [Spirochaetaceae bacterium]
MNSNPGDRIHIRDLTVTTVIGVYPEERDIRQDLILNVEIMTDLKEAGLTDDFERTIDYDTLTEKISELVENSSFKLIESVAASVADYILGVTGVNACRVTVDKPGAVRRARSVAVEIFRDQQSGG